MDRKQRRRVVAIVLAFLSAAGLVVASIGNRWLAGPDFGDDFGIGLRSVETCKRLCVSMSSFDAIDKLEAEIQRTKVENLRLPPNQQSAVPPSPWHGFPIVGMIAFVAALTAAAGLFISGLIALAGKRVALPIMPTTIAVIALALAIINGCIFVATKPSLMALMTIGWTFIVFGAAAIAGLAAVFPLNRQIRPIDSELGAASATMSWGGSRDDEP